MRVDYPNISQGFFNLIMKKAGHLDEATKESAANKAEICEKCPAKNNYKCNKCGCYLPAKLLSNSKCPLNKF